MSKSGCVLVSVLLCSAAAARGDYRFYSVPADRWGASAEVTGTRGFIIEDFEDATLAAGLQVRWYTGAGDSGPFSVLPNAFDPAADPFGSAFVGGAWDFSHCMVNTRDNQSHAYTDATAYGDVEFDFNPPVKGVGFSLEQADLNVGVAINGTDMGTVAALAGVPGASGHNGYIVIEATGSSTISTLRLKNTRGPGFADGWTIDHLTFTTTPAAAFTVQGVPGSSWAASDASLRLLGLSIENFEDANLATGLQVGIESPLGNFGPSNVLPNTFVAGAQDPYGTAFNLGAWDGTHMLVNTRDNLSHPYADVGNWGDMIFTFSPQVSVVGFSMEDTDQATRILVNGRNVGELFALVGFPVSGRNGYVRISGQGNTINTVRIDNGRAGYNDGIAFDHLAFGVPCVADLDNDHTVTTLDLSKLLGRFGLAAPLGSDAAQADLNGDGIVNTVDLALLLGGFGTTCP